MSKNATLTIFIMAVSIGFVTIGIGCFKNQGETPTNKTDKSELGPAFGEFKPINLLKYNRSLSIDSLPDALVKQNDGYEEFVLPTLNPGFSFDYTFIEYDLPVPEYKDVHENSIKIKYRTSIDGSNWSSWFYDYGHMGDDLENPVRLVHIVRHLGPIGSKYSTSPQNYLQIVIESFAGTAGDTIISNPSYAVTRYNRSSIAFDKKLQKKL